MLKKTRKLNTKARKVKQMNIKPTKFEHGDSNAQKLMRGISVAINALDIASRRFANPEFGCEWYEASEDCQRTKKLLLSILESTKKQ